MAPLLNYEKILLHCLFFVLLSIRPVLNFSWPTTTQLRDLETTTLTTEVGSWYLSSTISGTKVSQCDGVWILGGYQVLGGSGTAYNGQFFQRQYVSLPTHNQINLSMKIYALDSWDALNTSPVQDDHFEVSFDGRKVWGWAIAGYLNPAATPICGNPGWNDYPPFTMKITMPHIDSALTLRITSYLNEDSTNESLGFRDIVMDFIYQDEPQVTICGTSPIALPDKPCPCDATNEYMSPIQSGTCSLCHASCATCFGGSNTQCLSCPAGNRYFKDSQCPLCSSACATCDGGAANQCTSCISHYFMVKNSCYPTCNPPLYHYEISDITYCETPCPNQYAYWDNTCSTACVYPLIPKIESSLALCTFPCSDHQYLYWNGSCSINCDPPFERMVDHNRNFCVYPCTASEYVYWDHTCESTCNPPLVKYSIPTYDPASGNPKPIIKDFCAYPCELYEYLMWDGTCTDSCEAPLVAKTDHGRQFCVYPCLLTKYLYFNGSCLDSCPSPFKLRVVDSRSYCDYGCIDTLEYLYWNDTCGPCNPPLARRIEAGKKYCDFQCPETQFLYWDGTCGAACSPPLIQIPQGDPVTREFCTFPCGLNQYMYWNGTCSDVCAFPFLKKVYKGRNYCDFRCAVSEYSYWNGTCQGNCPIPFLTRLEGNPTRKYCDYPCTDSTTLFWNDTCGVCVYPLVTRVNTIGQSYCDYPCADDEYLYWEGSCNSTCAFPLREDIQGEIILKKFCHFPCLETQYLYWNGTCSYYCDFPYIVGGEYDRMTCNYPCLVEEYSYYNGTCMSSCDLPLKHRNESNRNYCDFPCKTYEFLAWDGTCLSFCDFPYVTLRYDGLQFCRLPCYSDYFYFPESMMCNETCQYPYYNDTQLPYMRCFPPVPLDFGPDFLESNMNPGTVSFKTLIKMMQYLRYLNVELPQRVQRLALSKGRPVLSTMAGIQLEADAIKFFERFVSLENIYSKHGLKQSFLANYWDTLTTLLIFTLAGIVLWIFERFLLLIDYQRWALIFERFRVVMKFNFPIMMIAYSIDEIILYAYFEFSTLSSRSYSSVSSTVSFLVCLLFVVSIPGLVCLTYYIIRRNRFYEAQVAARQNVVPKDKGEGRVPDGYRDLNVKKIRFESFQVLYRGFKEDSIWNQMFFSIYMMRIGLPMIIAICCENKPLVCCFLQLLVSVAIVNYLFWMKPFKKRVNYYQIIIYELGVVLLNVCVGLLTLIRVTNSNSSYPLAVTGLSNALLAGNGLLNILLVVFLVIKCVLEIFAIYKEMEKQGIQGVRKGIAFLQVPFIYLQEGNMGFEEIMNYQPYSKVPKKRPIFSAQALTDSSFLGHESYRGLNVDISHRELDVSYTGDQSTIVETRITRQNLRTEEDSVVGLPNLPSLKDLPPSPREIEKAEPIFEEQPIIEEEPVFEEITRPRKKSLVIESPSKERKEWEEETIPKIKREGIKRKPLKKQYGGTDFRNLNF